VRNKRDETKKGGYMNQQVTALSSAQQSETERVSKIATTGQFSYFVNPPNLWPDFLAGQANQPLRVILIDEDAHMRNIVGQELGLDARTTLVATAGNLREGKNLIANYAFDVMLLDLNLRDGMSFELLKYMKIHRPVAEAIVISMVDDEQNAVKAFDLGANGFIVKNSWFGNFAQAVLQVANGGAFISPSVARRLIKKLTGKPTMDSRARSDQITSLHGSGVLSYREREILELIADGCTSAAIAQRINISCQTVTTHLKNIYLKLKVHTRAQAVSYAKSQGLLG
jgi:DNA-binding NarL/FixJ family response regulator